MILFFALLLLIPAVTFAQSSISTDIGNTTFYDSDNRSGTRQSIGNTDFYNFSDGSSTTRNRVGSTDIYSGSTPSLSGSTNRIGDTTFGTWQDGTTSTHQSIGGTTFHSYGTPHSLVNGSYKCCVPTAEIALSELIKYTPASR